MKLSEIVARLGGRIDPLAASPIIIDRVATLQTGGEGAISFYTQSSHRRFLATTTASAVVTSAENAPLLAGKVCLIVEDPYVYFARLSQLFSKWQLPVGPFQDPTACVAQTVQMGQRVFISAQVVIEDNVIIGDNVYCGPGVFIKQGARIGAQVVLHAHVCVYQDCVIGDQTIIHTGGVIGDDGFGFARHHGQWTKIFHSGRVLVGSCCDIGALVTISRGTIDDTVIGHGVIIDNHVLIGHNVHIGDDTVIAGGAAIAGSSKIGRRCMLGGACRVRDVLPDDTVVTATSFVAQGLAHVKEYSSAWPAMDRRAWLKNVAQLRRIGQLVRTVQQLEKEMTVLKKKMPQ